MILLSLVTSWLQAQNVSVTNLERNNSFLRFNTDWQNIQNGEKLKFHVEYRACADDPNSPNFWNRADLNSDQSNFANASASLQVESTITGNDAHILSTPGSASSVSQQVIIRTADIFDANTKYEVRVIAEVLKAPSPEVTLAINNAQDGNFFVTTTTLLNSQAFTGEAVAEYKANLVDASGNVTPYFHIKFPYSNNKDLKGLTNPVTGLTATNAAADYEIVSGNQADWEAFRDAIVTSGDGTNGTYTFDKESWADATDHYHEITRDADGEGNARQIELEYAIDTKKADDTMGYVQDIYTSSSQIGNSIATIFHDINKGITFMPDRTRLSNFVENANVTLTNASNQNNPPTFSVESDREIRYNVARYTNESGLQAVEGRIRINNFEMPFQASSRGRNGGNTRVFLYAGNMTVNRISNNQYNFTVYLTVGTDFSGQESFEVSIDGQPQIINGFTKVANFGSFVNTDVNLPTNKIYTVNTTLTAQNGESESSMCVILKVNKF